MAIIPFNIVRHSGLNASAAWNVLRRVTSAAHFAYLRWLEANDKTFGPFLLGTNDFPTSGTTSQLAGEMKFSDGYLGQIAYMGEIRDTGDIALETTPIVPGRVDELVNAFRPILAATPSRDVFGLTDTEDFVSIIRTSSGANLDVSAFLRIKGLRAVGNRFVGIREGKLVHIQGGNVYGNPEAWHAYEMLGNGPKALFSAKARISRGVEVAGPNTWKIRVFDDGLTREILLINGDGHNAMQVMKVADGRSISFGNLGGDLGAGDVSITPARGKSDVIGISIVPASAASRRAAVTV